MIDNFNHTQSQPFYNSINLSDAQWNVENEKAKSLQSIIERVFADNPTIQISGWLMLRYLENKLGKRVNLNSVRRSITNLKKEGKIYKTTIMRTGEEGQPEHLYSLTSINENSKSTQLPGKTITDYSHILCGGTLKQKELFE